eukprot:2864095-Rhodomonas_salina.3
MTESKASTWFVRQQQAVEVITFSPSPSVFYDWNLESGNQVITRENYHDRGPEGNLHPVFTTVPEVEARGWGHGQSLQSQACAGPSRIIGFIQ